MATRMQQRRGTAAEWTSADPVLASGEIGYETDTNQFKIGDGTTAWTSLNYFKDSTDLDGDFITDDEKGAANGVASLDSSGQIPVSQLGNIIDAAPSTLDTMAEIAAALTDADGIVQQGLDALEASMTTYVDDNISGLQSDVSSNTSAITSNTSAISGLDTRLTTAEGDITTLQGDLSTTNTNLSTLEGEVDTNAANIATNAADIATNAGNLTTHESTTTSVHGIADTSALETQTGAQSKADAAETAANSYTDSAISTHNGVTTNVHGIADTSVLATQTYVDTAESDANGYTDDLIGDATVDGTAGNTVTDRIATAESDANGYADTAIGTHNSTTTSVHGIADTSKLVTTNAASQTLEGDLTVSGDLIVSGTTTTINTKNYTTRDNMIYLNQAGEFDITNAVGDGTSVTYTAPGHNYEVGDSITITGIDPTGYNISAGDDLSIDSISGDDFVVLKTDTGTYVSGGVARGKSHANPDLGWAAGRYDGSYGHAGVFRDASDATFKFFDGYVPEPDDDVFIDTTHASFALADLAVANLTADGIVFSDGTQTKQGVPSITDIAEQTTSYTLSNTGERDTIVEMNSASAVTVTIPADSSVNFPIGTTLDIIQTGAGQVTIAGDTGVTVNATPGLKLRTQWSACTLLKRGSDLWMAYGDLQA